MSEFDVFSSIVYCGIPAFVIALKTNIVIKQNRTQSDCCSDGACCCLTRVNNQRFILQCVKISAFAARKFA